nr:MAG TPA: hypothetical protein [Caudoviricetes sp.]
MLNLRGIWMRGETLKRTPEPGVESSNPSRRTRNLKSLCLSSGIRIF